MPDTDIGEVVKALVGLLETADGAAITGMLAPGAVLWHNDDGVDIDAPKAFAAIGGLHALVRDVHVDVTNADHTDGGFAIRLVIRGVVRSSGAKLAARNCIFVDRSAGRITRLEEYVDPTFRSQLAP